MTIRPPNDEDCAQIARLHHTVLTTTTSVLGIPYLTDLYAWFINENNHAAWIACERDAVVGVLTATTSLGKTERNLITALGRKTAWLTIRAVLGGNVRIGEILRRMHFERTLMTIPEEPYMYISTFGVSPAMRRRGIGSSLIKSAEQECAIYGIRRLYVDTREENHQAILFYESRGFRRLRTIDGNLVLVKNQ